MNNPTDPIIDLATRRAARRAPARRAGLGVALMCRWQLDPESGRLNCAWVEKAPRP